MKAAPTEVSDAIRASTRSTGRLHAGQATYNGILRINAPWGRYTRTMGIERLTRADALLDAEQRRRDWIAVNQLPE